MWWAYIRGGGLYSGGGLIFGGGAYIRGGLYCSRRFTAFSQTLHSMVVALTGKFGNCAAKV